MPLIPGKSKKAISKNIETEMEAGKPKAQSIAIAYNMKRKKKKYADGGKVESAASERRPMPEERANDSKMVSHSASKKPLVDASWTGQPTVKQAQNNNGRRVLPIKHPKMVKSNVLQVRMRDEEDHLQDSVAVNDGPQRQPPEVDNEEEADKSGPDVPALHMKKMAEGGMINKRVSMHEAEEDRVEHPAGLESDNDQMAPSEDDYMSEHDAAQYAEGGEVSPESEEMDEHHSSIAAAIMAKKAHKMMLAEGGEILDHDDADDIKSHDSIYSDKSSQADLSRNADEDANEEDQLSWNALRKENYSESEGLDALDQPHDSNLHGDSREDEESDPRDRVSTIRRKMNVKRQFSK